jgi:hypothetical protein
LNCLTKTIKPMRARSTQGRYLKNFPKLLSYFTQASIWKRWFLKKWISDNDKITLKFDFVLNSGHLSSVPCMQEIGSYYVLKANEFFFQTIVNFYDYGGILLNVSLFIKLLMSMVWSLILYYNDINLLDKNNVVFLFVHLCHQTYIFQASMLHSFPLHTHLHGHKKNTC